MATPTHGPLHQASTPTTSELGEGTSDVPQVSVVIPAYNELKRLPPTLRAVEKYLSENFGSWEILVADDGSTDGTIELVRPQFPRVQFIEAPRNMGKGAAVRRGMLTARGKIVLFSDADLSTPIEELGEMSRILGQEGYDCVIASRDLPGSKLEVHQSWYRELSGKVFNFLVRMLSGLPFQDTQCGFKLFTRRAARAIFSQARSDRFAFDVEVLMIARKLGCKTFEQPVRWINDAEGSKLHFMTDGPKMVLDILRFRWWSLRGVYSRSKPLAELEKK